MFIIYLAIVYLPSQLIHAYTVDDLDTTWVKHL